MEDSEEGIRISKTTAGLMIGVAFFYDTLQALLNMIPIVGTILAWFIVPITFLTFNVLWFHINGVHLFESVVGKIGKFGLQSKMLSNFMKRILLPVAFEIFTLGVAPGITIWITITVLQTRASDKAIQLGLITEEDLDALDDIVKVLGKKHGGYDTKEFRKAFGNHLGDELKERGTERIRQKLQSTKSYDYYQKASRFVDTIPRESLNRLDLSTAPQPNPNSIGKMVGRRTDLPTTSDKVYRSVRGDGAIQDLVQSGVVRNKQTAGLSKNRWGDNVYWSRGADGQFHTVQQDGHIIEAPYDIASQRAVTKDDLTAIHRTEEDGSTKDILPDLKRVAERSTLLHL